jgi:hypothetical protein
MQSVEHVFEMSRKILHLSDHVHIDMVKLGETAKYMLEHPLPEKQVDDHKVRKPVNLNSRDAQGIILKELVSDAVNYCYWQFSSSYRPNGAGSTRMRELLEQSFNPRWAMASPIDLTAQLRNFYRAMMINRFPLMDQRLKHLMALTRPLTMVGASGAQAYNSRRSVGPTFVQMIQESFAFERLFNFLITEIDGYGDDPFLKRAFLFFLQLNRVLGLFEDDIQQFPVPADYQVPKMLFKYEILVYSPVLEHKIFTHTHLEENGPEEMAIRAGTIRAAQLLGEITGWSASDVDGWFFIRRKESEAPFHLCITSNY